MNTDTKDISEKQLKSKNKQMDMLNGRLWSKILLFSMPIALTNILQQLFNTADIAVVGQIVGNDTLAAVGCTGPIVTLFISLFSGLSLGVNAVISRFIGARNTEGTKKAVHTALTIALISGIIVAVLGEIAARPLLVLVSTPENVIDLAVLYLRIYFSGSIFLMLYNTEAAILYSIGDTKKPVFILLAAGIINIGLNLFFVIVCKMSVGGVALATLISNALSAATLFIVLLREKRIIKVNISDIRLYKGMSKMILKIGIPTALQGIIFNAANIVLQSGINELGSDVVAGSTVGLNIELFAYYIVAALGQASITFNSQNLGAGNLKRCAQATKWCIILGVIITAVSSVIIVTFREFLAGLFTPDEAIVKIASIRILIIVGFEVINMMIEVLSGTLRGLGYSALPTFLCVFFICGIRTLWLFFIFPLNKTFLWIIVVYPISWVFTVASLTIAYFYVKKKLAEKIRTAY